MILETALKLFPEDPFLLYTQASCGGFMNDTMLVNKKVAYLAELSNYNALQVSVTKANIYTETGHDDLAEKYLRKALLLSGNTDYRRYKLAEFLIEKDKDVDSGMKEIMYLWEKTFQGTWNNDAGYYTALGFLKQGKLHSADSVFRILEDSTITASLRVDKLRKALEDARYGQK
jgi:hypothetical protein